MKPYIIYQEDGEDYVLQRGFPHYVGKITFKPERDLTHFPIAGYYLYVTINSTLRGSYVPGLKHCDTDLLTISDDMSNWALNYIIKDNPKYKDYKYDTVSNEQSSSKSEDKIHWEY